MGLIRFLLACGVVLGHTSTLYGYTPLGGNLAVQVFYIISGFYMAMILTEKYYGKGSTYLFYTNRALKIYPIYGIVLILLIIASLIVYKLHYPGTFDYYFKYAHPSTISIIYLVIVNLIIFGLETVFLVGINKDGNFFLTRNFNQTNPQVYHFAFNPIAWTVGIELLFYLIAPWLVRRSKGLLLIIICFSLMLRVLLEKTLFEGPPWDYMFFPTQLMFFAAGILSYRFYKTLNFERLNKNAPRAIYIFLLLIILFYYQILPESYLKNVLLFLAVTVGIPFGFDLTKKIKWDKFLGNLSYPIYIIFPKHL